VPRVPETSVIVFGDRHNPIEIFTDTIKALAASGVVDDLGMSDQMGGFFPPMLWTPENTPVAEILPDIDSHADGQAMLAYAAAIAPGAKFSIMTDSIRRGPAELIQSMLTVANMTEGRVQYHIGGGEVKQCRPFGWKRSQGLARLEDLFVLFHKVWNSNAPVDHEGHHTTFKNAWFGGAKRFRPKLWGLGGGPKLLDLVTTYCDGLSVATPCVWATPELAGEHIAAIREMLIGKARDPDEFEFGICCPVLLHDDAEVVDSALDNPLIRWLAAVFGRVEPQDWVKVGLESPWPAGWNYYMKLVPGDEPESSVRDVLFKTSHAMADLSTFHGSPSEVAAQLQRYVDVGVGWVQVIDYLPLILPPEDGQKGLARTLEMCTILKAGPQ